MAAHPQAFTALSACCTAPASPADLELVLRRMRIGPCDLWSDDPKDDNYNLMVRAPHGFSHEKLRRADPLYDLVILTDWNWPFAVPGRGSAIFLHRWRRPGYPTAGCVAFDPQDLLWIAQRIRHQTRLIVR